MSMTSEPVICESADTLVLALGHTPASTLEEELAGYDGEIYVIGDCLAPRTAEEAVLDGLVVGTKL